MKILVTADWHIGKKLHNEDLSEDINLFFDWLLEKIKTENNVPKSMSSLLKTELSKDIVTVTVEKIVSFSTTGESEFPMDPSIDIIPQALVANKEKQIQCAIISGVSAQPMRTDVATAMAAMIKSAKADGISLAINSGFRPAFPAGWPPA